MNIEEFLQGIKLAGSGWVLIIPLVLIVLDCVTGVLNAWVRNEIKSSIMRQGLAKKIGEMIVLGIGELFSYGLVLSPYVMTGVSAYIVIMELVSICENLKKLGVPIPKFVDRALNETNEKIQNGMKEGEDDAKSNK